MKKDEEICEEKMKLDENIVRNISKQESRRRKGANDIDSDYTGTKRRRMSKKERKALKHVNKQKNLKFKNEKSLALNSSMKSRQEIDEDVEAEEERTRLECLKSYDPIDIPKEPSTDLISQRQNREGQSTTQVVDAEGGCRTLGKWFPNAIVMKTISYTNTGQLIVNMKSQQKGQQTQRKEDLIVKDPKSSLVLFYQYTTSDCEEGDHSGNRAKMWDRGQLQLLITYLSTIASHRNIGGRIRVAPEGVNATLSAVDTKKCTAKAALRHLAEDLRRFDQRVFSRTDFKFLDDLPADRHFKEIKILPVQELVFYDIDEDDAPLNASGLKNGTETNSNMASRGGGIHLDAKEYHEMLQKDNTVVIDVRNNYETILGRFDGQQQRKQDKSISTSESDLNEEKSSSLGGAEYIDPKMRKVRYEIRKCDCVRAH